MSAANLPDPLVPPEVDLRDFPGMWVDTDRLLRSDTWILGSSDEKAAAFTLWAESWHQVPAASLPGNDRVLAKLSQAERWTKSKEHALRGWIACNDGRLYHPVVAEKALEAWLEKLGAAITGAAGNAKRWGVKVDTELLRRQFATSVGMLRSLAPASRALKKKIVAVILAGSHPESGPESGADDRRGSGGDSGPDRGPISGADRKGPGQGPDHIERGSSAGAHETAYGEIVGHIRRAGIARAAPGNARFRALVDAGATAAEFTAHVPAALAKGDEAFTYLLGIVAGERKRAAELATQLHRGQMPVNPQRTTATDRRLSTIAALTGKDRSHAASTPSDVVDVDARPVT